MLYLTGRLQVTDGLLWAHKENDSIKGRKDDLKLMFNQDYTGHGTSSWVGVVIRAVVVVSVVVKCMIVVPLLSYHVAFSISENDP